LCLPAHRDRDGQLTVADRLRLLLEIVIFGLGVAALARRPDLFAAIFGGVVTIHLALTFVLGQR
jgi:hypothetical protein